MNRLSAEKRSAVVRCLVEGNSIRSTVRITGAAKNTVVKLLVELGEACAEYQYEHLRGLSCQRIQADEIWAYCNAKARNVPAEHEGDPEWGDVWTWTAIDADSKLVLSSYVGDRDAGSAFEFMQDVASRLTHRVQLTTDGHSAYLEAVEASFGAGIDYAQLIKLYGPDPEGERRYSPPICIGYDVRRRAGNPDPAHISTSHVERQNLTMRMGMRRFTRLTNAYSKKLRNLEAAVALHFMYYNFARPHHSLKNPYPRTPAMAAGITDHIWKLEEIVELLNYRRGQM